MIPSDTKLRRGVLFLVVGLCLYGFWRRDLTYYDEPRYARVAYEMATTPSWSLPLLNGEPYTEKPPWFFWLAGVSGLVFGFGPFGMLLPNVLAHLLTCLLVFRLGARTMTTRAGLLAALVYACCPLVLHYGRSAQLDPQLVLGETLAAYGLLMALERRGARDLVLAGLGFGLGALVKGHLVLVALFAPLARRVALGPSPRRIGPLAILAVCAIGLAPFAAWFSAVVGEFGWARAVALYFEKQVVDHTSGRVNHYSPIPIGVEYLGALAAMLPASAFLIGAIRRREGAAPWRRVYLLWAAGVFVLFSLVPAKREIYLLPMAVPLALAVGDYLACLERDGARWFRFGARGMFAFGVLLLTGAVGLPVYLATQRTLSVDAVLCGVAALAAARFSLPALWRADGKGGVLLVLQLAVVALFAEPAVGAFATSRDSLRSFGAEIRAAVPEGERLVVVEMSKIHGVLWFGDRLIDQVEEASDVPAPAAGATSYVVLRKRDFSDLRDREDVTVRRVAREEQGSGGKELFLVAVSAAPSGVAPEGSAAAIEDPGAGVEGGEDSDLEGGSGR